LRVRGKVGMGGTGMAGFIIRGGIFAMPVRFIFMIVAVDTLFYGPSTGSAPLGNSTHIWPPCFMRPA